MTQHLTRRELREAERAGKPLRPSSFVAPRVAEAAPSAEVKPARPLQQEISNSQLTRRQMREMGMLGSSAAESETPQITSNQGQEAPTATGDSRRARRAAQSSPDLLAEPQVISAPEIDYPEATFTGQNLFSEPSTASIVLESMPEAITLPIETGEIAITGSIEVISGPMTGPSTAALEGMDGLDLDDSESVTGVISTVEPISALKLIDARSSFVTVPAKVLRKGWWKPWAVGAGSIALLIAAILSVMTILSAVGG